MNRPLWLNILRVWAFLSPPLFLAAVLATFVARHFGWPFWAWACAYGVAAVACFAAWLAIAVAWSWRGETDGDAA